MIKQAGNQNFFVRSICTWTVAGVLILPTSSSFAQYTFLQSIPVSADLLTTEQLGHCYLIAQNQLSEYDSTGHFLRSYDEKNLGKLQSVDASNPLKLLLFYPDFAQINILDSKLAIQRSVQMRTIGIQLPLLVCSSGNGGIWVFDQQDFQLKKIDIDLTISQQSGNLGQLTGTDIVPTSMVEAYNRVYMNNPSAGVLVFDNFGTYIKTIPIPHITCMQVVENELLFCKNDSLHSFNLNTLQEKMVTLPDKAGEWIDFRIEKGRLFLRRKDKVDIFGF